MIFKIWFVFSLYFPQLFYQRHIKLPNAPEQSIESERRSNNNLHPVHPYQRMLTKSYLEKKKIVRSIWIAAGLLMVGFPLPPFIVTLALFTTFLSFTILDESR